MEGCLMCSVFDVEGVWCGVVFDVEGCLMWRVFDVFDVECV